MPENPRFAAVAKIGPNYKPNDHPLFGGNEMTNPFDEKVKQLQYF